MLFPVLRPHTNYTHSGEIFSKLMFLDASQKKHGTLIHIVGHQEIERKYESVALDLNIRYKKLSNFEDLSLKNTSPQILSLQIDDLESVVELSSIEDTLQLSQGLKLSMESLMKKLQELGYEFHEYEKAGSYNRNGDILKITLGSGETLSINYWGDEIESLLQNGHQSVEHISLSSLKSLFDQGEITKHTKYTTLLEIIQEKQIFCVVDTLEFHPLFKKITAPTLQTACFTILGAQDENFIDLGVSGVYCTELESFKKILGETNTEVKIFTRHQLMLDAFMQDNNFADVRVYSTKSHLLTSFRFGSKFSDSQIVYLCDDILSKIFIKKRSRKKLSADVDLLLKIKNGDYIVHIDHGVGVFRGIITKELGNITKEYLEISYKDQDKLFVPITEVQRVSKYVGKENPSLTPLSGKIWERKMQKIHEDIRHIAQEILKNFAERKMRAGNDNLLDTKKMGKFQDMFPYTYTIDQYNAIEDIFKDMQSPKNMDRLIVGDVGFGKTEIAFNAAYLALLNKKQVVFISPLVVLAHEHYAKAFERFSELGVRIAVLTRLQSQAQASQVLRGIADGSIDMVIGTHRLLSEKLVWKKLGLMIVDEEHKFGVVDKEKIKNIKTDIDILSLSATPIPRSLNLALSGIRDISLLKTPPEGRKSIETYVIGVNEKIIQDAGNKEFARGGQIFFVHNRVSNIEVYKKQLEGMFPGKKVVITHGQLPGDELEDRILDFKNKKYDILLSTTVIENGIDFSNVNTIFINECQSFGISQIHQLRGRVGRSHAQGYCYLMYRKDHLDGEAAKRIQTIVDYSYLGAGFELAMKDLEIRGGGDILGIKQSGQSQEIGVSLFLKMLEEKIEELKEGENSIDKSQKRRKKAQIDLMITAGIPDSFFLSETDKLQFYRELETVEDQEELEYMKQTFFESQNETLLPLESENLFLLLETQILSKQYHIRAIRRAGINYQIDFSEDTDIQTLKAFLHRDREARFQVVDISKVRSPIKGFANDKIFIEYVLRILKGNTSGGKKKIKLKVKA